MATAATRKPKAITPMTLGERTTFEKRGRTYEIKEPEGPPSSGQLWLLWDAGVLVIADTPQSKFTKANASFAIDALKNGK